MMCGIVGVAGGLVARDEALMKKLLLWDWLRGQDATGLAAIRNNGEVHIAKVSDHPLALFEMGSFTRALKGMDSTVFLGHNRAATRGRNIHANTHPFEYGNIVGVHNGTLDWGAQQDLQKELGENFDVDSQALIAGIDRLGLKKTLGMLTGAWAIVYYDKRDNTINMIRNKERPLWYGYTKEFNRLFWASQWEFIRSAVELTGGYNIYADKDNIGYWQLTEDTHYKFDVEALRKGSDKMIKPKTKKVEGKQPTYSAGSGGAQSFFPTRVGESQRNTNRNSGTRSGGNGTGTRSTNTASRTTRTSADGDEILQALGTPNRPFGDWYERGEFDERTKYGCSWCEKPVPWGEPGVIIYERENSVLCPVCSGETRRNLVITKNLAA